MKDNFQIVVVIVFALLAIVGVLVFSGAIPIGNNNGAGSLGTVVLWGTISSSAMNPVLQNFNDANPTFVVAYEEKSPETFDQDLLEAIASGKGPDMFFLTEDLAFKYSNKIIVVPYQSYPLATFKSTFAGAGEVFLTSKGILAFPILIDPLVMYYNRSMLDANGITNPPSFWDEFLTDVSTLTKRDDSNKIIKSGAALGHYSNVAHAKDILTTLFMQTGNPILTEKNGNLQSTLGLVGQGVDLSSVLQFYSDFANPLKNVYSWNKSFPMSNSAFSSEDLAFYFGYADELNSLVNQNPNQNFGVAPIPQIRSSNSKLTGAKVTGVAISAFSKNSNTAFLAASQMALTDFSQNLAKVLGVAPAKRDALGAQPDDAYSPTFYKSALFSRTWMDPSSRDTDSIFRSMIDGVLSNSLSTNESIKDADTRLDLLLTK